MAKTILLIEDDTGMVTLLKNLINKLEYNFEYSTDGLSGLEKARNINPDLIILDIMLPRLDGFRLSRYLKFDETYQHIPILMLTAKSEEIDQKTGQTTGADAYLTKPFDEKKLIDTIQRLIA